MAFMPSSDRLVPAVDRAARLLEALAKTGEDRTLADLTQEIGIPSTAARDILLTLRQHGLVERDATTGRYRLGIGIARLARVAMERMDIRQMAHPFVAELAAQVDETVALAVRDEQQVVLVDVVEPAHDLHVSEQVGRRLPLSAGSLGKVFLAEPREFERYLERGGELPAYTPRSQTDPDIYEAELAVVRARGYALDDEEYHAGVRSASALVKGPVGEQVAAITIVGYRTRLPLPTLEALGEACLATAKTISARLNASNG